MNPWDWMTFDRCGPAGMALALVQDWLADRGITIGAYDEMLDHGGGHYSFRGVDDDFIITVKIDSDADFDGDRYVDRSTVREVKIVPA